MLDSFALIGAMMAMAFVIEPKRHKEEVRKHPLRDMADTVHYALHGHAEIAGIILFSCVIFTATKLMLWAQQPYYELVGIPVHWFGVIMAVNYIISGAVGHQSHKFEKLGSNRQALAFMGLLIIVACAAMAALPSVALALVFFMAGTLTYAVGQPRVSNAINGLVGSERRATILSTASLMVHVLFIPTSLIMGWLTEHGSVRTGLFYVAGQIALLGGIGLWLWKKPVTDPVPA